MLIDKKKIVTSSGIRKLAGRANKNESGSLDYLQRHGYIDRILRGIYYVRSADERERGFYDWSIYEMVAEALVLKGVKRWYFSLETALKLNDMTHEYFTVDFATTDSFRTTKVIGILGSKFQFYKWSAVHFEFGIKKKGALAYSNKEKTVLDIAYKKYRDGKSPKLALDTIKEYSSTLDERILEKYIEYYPARFRRAIGGLR